MSKRDPDAATRTSQGVGFDQHTYLINFSYNLETGSLSNYTRGAFEFGLKLRLLEKK